MSNAKNENRMPRFVYVKLVADRAKELDSGMRPLVPTRGRSAVEIAVDEIAKGKVTADIHSPDQPLPNSRPEALFNHEGD